MHAPHTAESWYTTMMVSILKQYAYVVGALLCAFFIIGLALYVRSHEDGGAEGGVIALPAPDRTSLAVPDSDGDGIPDWQNELVKNIIASVSTTSALYDTNATYTPPTTFTGRFAEEFFKDYLVRKGSGETFEDPSALVENAVNSIEASTGASKHSRLDINLISDSETEVREYANALGAIILAHPTGSTANEAVIFSKALQEQNPGGLDALKPRKEAYEAILRETLLVPVPEPLISTHLDILNAYEAIILDIEAMELAFDDPLLALARLKKYPDDAEAFVRAFKELSSYVTSRGIVYTKDEPGAMLYIFDALNI